MPAANVGIVLSGSGSEREFTQRLGRILRPTGADGDGADGDGAASGEAGAAGEADGAGGTSGPAADPTPGGDGDRALLYELVTRGTAEERVAARRR